MMQQIENNMVRFYKYCYYRFVSVFNKYDFTDLRTDGSSGVIETVYGMVNCLGGDLIRIGKNVVLTSLKNYKRDYISLFFI